MRRAIFLTFLWAFSCLPALADDASPITKTWSMSAYTVDLQRRIRRRWFPCKDNEGNLIVILFKIHKDGTFSGLRLDHSSAIAIVDNAALKSVENASPFLPLPDEAHDEEEVQFIFDNKAGMAAGKIGPISYASSEAYMILSGWQRTCSRSGTASNYVQLGRAYEFVQRKPAAVEAYKKALQIDANNQDAKQRLDFLLNAEK